MEDKEKKKDNKKADEGIEESEKKKEGSQLEKEVKGQIKKVKKISEGKEFHEFLTGSQITEAKTLPIPSSKSIQNPKNLEQNLDRVNIQSQSNKKENVFDKYIPDAGKYASIGENYETERTETAWKDMNMMNTPFIRIDEEIVAVRTNGLKQVRMPDWEKEHFIKHKSREKYTADASAKRIHEIDNRLPFENQARKYKGRPI